ncbi:DUF5786 family protein [Halocalculus aciditolerans]|uniref:DUF5786 domain-containing protein n=1 Tax=Halocalculus aciditolerans TaxID=1383812 RepID=A0A830F0C0_9EURY|nr:DUF5786 family protein [Halocalculus aciditolerans]GGL48568.1 hypothetical protein GCM10009039_03480 [Halocalculus aciditolerans]
MGFGSYDESEQERQSFDSDEQDGSTVTTEESTHNGRIDFTNGASNDELIDKLKDIKEQ